MNTSLIVMLTVCLSLIIALLVVLWKLDERVLRLEALVKCMESEIIAIRRKAAFKED